MARYIEREKTIKAVVSAIPKALGHGIPAIAMVEIVDAIEELSIADVEEVRHAYWVKASCSEWDGDANCSYCGNWDWSDKKYCSSCGAKMDGDKTVN